MKSGILKIGLIGTIVSVLCCFTPLLVVLLGALGLSGLVGILDYVLIPALLFFTCLLGYGLYKKRSV